MPPRTRRIRTDHESRFRNMLELEGKPGMGGLVRVGGSARAGGLAVPASAVQAPPAAAESAGSAQLLTMSATGASVASGGDLVTFDTIVEQRGFSGVVVQVGDGWVHPISGVYALVYEHAWDTYEDGGTIELLLDGAVHRTITSGGTGARSFDVIAYYAEAGQVGGIRVTQISGSAQTCDAAVQIFVTDPTQADQPENWRLQYSGDTWGIVFDGTHWWTTNAGDGTVTKRDTSGAAVASFSAALDKARGVTSDGADLWIAGDDTPNGNEEILRHATDGTLEATVVTGPSSDSNAGLAWDGSHLWLVEDAANRAERYTTAGVLDTSFALPASVWAGVAIHDGDLFIVDSTNATLERYTPAGVWVDTIDLSGAGSTPTDVWIDADGALYVAVDGDGVYRRNIPIGGA